MSRMLTHSRVCTAAAAAPLGFVDITAEVERIVEASGVDAGRATILRTEDGCALVLNEQEKGLHADVQATIERLSSQNGSGPPPVGSASLVLPIRGGRLYLGTWQRVLMIELQQPCDRKLSVQVVGE